MSKTHVILNYAEHDFHLPILPNLEKKIGEKEEEHIARVKAVMDMRPGESKEDFEERMAKTSLLFPKMLKEKGDKGKPGYQAEGPSETTITDEQLQIMRKHRIASQWFGRDLKKGGGLAIKDAGKDESEEGGTRAKGKAA